MGYAQHGEKIYRVEAYRASARVILNLLGFSSFTAFSQVSGVGHMTVSDMLYKTKKRHICQRATVFSKVFETLVSSYEEHKDRMRPMDRKYAKAWIQDWARRTIQSEVETIKLGKRKSGVGVKQRMQTQRRIRHRRARLEAITKGFCG